jgi:hypothetical protein
MEITVQAAPKVYEAEGYCLICKRQVIFSKMTRTEYEDLYEKYGYSLKSLRCPDCESK